MAFERISVDHRVMAGVPCIARTRIPVATVVGMVAEGMTVEEILDDFPQLTKDDVREALEFAAALASAQELLEAGALVVVEPNRLRVRQLPIT